MSKIFKSVFLQAFWLDFIAYFVSFTPQPIFPRLPCLHFPALICFFCAPAKFEMKMGALKCVSPIVNNVKLKAENVERRNNFTEVISVRGEPRVRFEVIAKSVLGPWQRSVCPIRACFEKFCDWIFGESLLPVWLQGFCDLWKMLRMLIFITKFTSSWDAKVGRCAKAIVIKYKEF